MGRQERQALIQQIEQARGGRVLAYVTSDRQIPGIAGLAQIGDDAMRPIFDHLREMVAPERVDLIIYSRGGAIDVPWRIATALRATAAEWHILIPFRANSAASLIALGADKIFLGRHGELGPIDPILNLPRLVPQPAGQPPLLMPDQVSVEDLMAYLKFARDRAGLSDQASLTHALTLLGNRMDAAALGSAYRTHSHIRDVARRMLTSRKNPPPEQTMSTIIETMAERVYAHGHAIGLRTAVEIGLPAESANAPLDDMLWRLLKEYEEQMKLLDPLDPMTVLGAADTYSEPAVIAAVESTWAVHEFTGQLHVRAQRQQPPNLNVALNLNLQVPAGVNPAALQQVLQQLQPAIVQQAQQAVQDALKQQAPIVGAEIAVRGGRWVRSP